MHRILSIDPGTRFCGIALLVDGMYEIGQTLVVNELQEGEDIILNWFKRLRGLLKIYQPDTLLIEDYTYQGPARTSENSPLMFKQVGAFQCLGCVTPYPVVHLIDPRIWRKQLVGRELAPGGAEADAQVAWVLQQRFGEQCVPRSRSDGHWLDALGMAVTWGDTQVLLQHVVGK